MGCSWGQSPLLEERSERAKQPLAVHLQHHGKTNIALVDEWRWAGPGSLTQAATALHYATRGGGPGGAWGHAGVQTLNHAKAAALSMGDVHPLIAGFCHTHQVILLLSCRLESKGMGAFELLFGRPVAFCIKA